MVMTWQFRRLPKYTRRGIPDIIAIKNGPFIGIAVFGCQCIDAGGEYIVARSMG
jgi:hypothetical protein